MSELGKIAVIGGTGNLGAAMARRWAKAGLDVTIGSRSAESAQARAEELGFGLRGAANADAAAQADIVVIAVPFAAQEGTLADIKDAVQGKLVVDTTVPLVPPKVMRVQLPPEGSAAVKAQGILGEGVSMCSGFHSVAAHKLITDNDVDCDVLVFGDSKDERAKVIKLAEHAGLRGIHGGALVNSAAGEALTSVLIAINKLHLVDGAGIRITGNLIP